MVAFGGSIEPTYTWEHYVASPHIPNQDYRVFSNKAEQVVGELWVSLHCTTVLCTSLSKGIREIMIGFAKSICRISIDARRDTRRVQPLWLTQPVLNS